MQLRRIAHIAAGDHQMGKAQDILPTVPAVKAQQHVTADGKVQLCPGVVPGQLFHREHRVIVAPGFGLSYLPPADFQLRDGIHPLFQCMEAAAHFQPQRTRGRSVLLER